MLLPLQVDQPGLAALATAVSTPGLAPVRPLCSRRPPSPGGSAPRPAVRARVISYLRRAGATHVAADSSGLMSRRRCRWPAPSVCSAPSCPRSGTDTRVRRRPVRRARERDPRARRARRRRDRRRRPRHAAAGADARRPHRSRWTTRRRPRCTRCSSAGLSESTSAARTCRGPAPRRDAPPAARGMAASPRISICARTGCRRCTPAGFTGKGERVALLEIDGFKPSDIQRFDGCYKLPTPHVKLFGVGIKRALAPGGETTLDLEVLSAAAPKLSDIDVYESSPAASSVLKSLIYAIESKTQRPGRRLRLARRLRARTTSGRWARKGIGLYETAFKFAAATGISVLRRFRRQWLQHVLHAEGPPDQAARRQLPGVLAVGDRRRRHQRPADRRQPADPLALGRLERRPGSGSRRPAAATACCSASPPIRTVSRPADAAKLPDVSMLADLAPGYEIYCSAKPQPCGKHGWLSIGGTSAGTPLLAGGVAVADQALRRAGRSGPRVRQPVAVHGRPLGGRGLGVLRRHAGLERSVRHQGPPARVLQRGRRLRRRLGHRSGERRRADRGGAGSIEPELAVGDGVARSRRSRSPRTSWSRRWAARPPA